MVRFACPRCGKRMKVADDAAGQFVPCLSCGNQVQVPYVVVAVALRRPVPVKANASDAPRYRRLVWSAVIVSCTSLLAIPLVIFLAPVLIPGLDPERDAQRAFLKFARAHAADPEGLEIVQWGPRVPDTGEETRWLLRNVHPDGGWVPPMPPWPGAEKREIVFRCRCIHRAVMTSQARVSYTAGSDAIISVVIYEGDGTIWHPRP